MDLNNESIENNVEGDGNINNNEINSSNEADNNSINNNNIDNEVIASNNNEINNSNEADSNNSNTDNNEAIAMEGTDKKEEENYKEEYRELKDQLLRNMAEFDNYKKRSENEIDNAKNIGKAELIKNLLSIIDEFDLTLLAVSESQEKNLLRGVELLYSNFIVELKKNGLEEIKSEGVFDPYKHEILMAKADSKPKNTILETIKKGYIFNGIMLRPASVIISNGEKQNKALKEE